ncbi:phosphatase tensin type domain-containing protein [Dictyostelium discoideum AX4]|uniref:Phosphatase and tensin homolog n=1 Tax=Dictyostelium discoideum TaxID=44689 RepID=Q54CH3_DICDI|nr:phosphatase tensin type domain-containing protein [Dictyostelium discoideum AX4]EAL61009.1 phosphatase tensin type domain-containing protein [Dictyostelium discoideum AX4]|eukprot:XP_629443.1 phosphatase tensin type domain-containing protein [Dictyostelium discoideum AX4]
MSDGSGFDYFRTIVSGRKKRFIQDGFNLDLSYITERILAMGYPADSIHKAFRNDINEVYNFFEKYHSAHWKILNVAMEISYSTTKVGGNVIVMGFEDHTPPPFLLLLDIIETMNKWLDSDEQNVIAVHCKAGKGRTGTVISSYLINQMKRTTPDLFYSSDTILYNTISFFNQMRANNSECVTVPSQKRYVGYYIQYLRDQVTHASLLSPAQFKILNIDVIGLYTSTQTPHFNIEIHLNYNPKIRNLPIIIRGSNTGIVFYQDFYSYILREKGIIAKGDTLIKFNSLDSPQCVFRFLFHTSFLLTPTTQDSQSIITLYFQKDNLDGGSGGAFLDSKYKTDFAIRVLLEPILSNNISNNNNYNNNNNNNNNSIENNNGVVLRKAPLPPVISNNTNFFDNNNNNNNSFNNSNNNNFNININNCNGNSIQPHVQQAPPPPVPCRSKKPIYSYEPYEL